MKPCNPYIHAVNRSGGALATYTCMHAGCTSCAGCLLSMFATPACLLSEPACHTADPCLPACLPVAWLQWWAGRSHNYTQKNSVGIRDVACRGTLCHKPYGPYPGLLSNETYCVIISRAPNATYNGSRAGDPGLVTVRYRARTDCGGAAAMRLTVGGQAGGTGSAPPITSH